MPDSAGERLPTAVDKGRECCRQRAWAEAFDALSRADQAGLLSADDLELLALSAYLIGRDDDYLHTLERAHHVRGDSGDVHGAARCAFWLGLRLAFRGEMGPASGWFGRAERLLDQAQGECVERGYLLLPRIEQRLGAGDFDAAHAAAAEATEIGERFADADLVACARHLQGRVLLQRGSVADGLALLDEAMVAVTAGELSPLVTGLIYCSVIEACQQAHALSRAREWTWALAQWCAEQPQLVSFTGSCLLHRAEIMRLNGAWEEAFDEARRAVERFSLVNNQKDSAAAWYEQAEVHRLRGDFAAAGKAYQMASRHGFEPQPGLALLWLAEGRCDAATAAVRRVVAATSNPARRARLLPACVEIMIAAGAIEEARRASKDLHDLASLHGAELLIVLAAHAEGSVQLAEGKAQAAVVSLGRALDGWQQLEAPYEAARARVLMGLACRTLGDHDSAALEFEAAKAMFQQLGARPDASRMDELIRVHSGGKHHLTEREMEVLRLIAAGKTNKATANELQLSARTVDRHVSNIFNKLGVASRAAATAWAYEHKLI